MQVTLLPVWNSWRDLRDCAPSQEHTGIPTVSILKGRIYLMLTRGPGDVLDVRMCMQAWQDDGIPRYIWFFFAEAKHLFLSGYT